MSNNLNSDISKILDENSSKIHDIVASLLKTDELNTGHTDNYRKENTVPEKTEILTRKIELIKSITPLLGENAKQLSKYIIAALKIAIILSELKDISD